MTTNHHKKSFRLAMSLAGMAAVLLVGCGQKEPPSVSSTLVGRSASEAMTTLGKPDSEHETLQTTSDECGSLRATGSIRTIEYHWPREGLSARIRRLFHMRPAGVLYLCVDRQNRVIATPSIEID